MRTKVTKADKAAFKQMTRKARPVSLTLVYKQGKYTSVISGFYRIGVDKYGLCQYKRAELEKLPQYQKGNIIIQSNYDN